MIQSKLNEIAASNDTIYVKWHMQWYSLY